MLSQGKFPKLKNFSLEMMAIFGSIYVREAVFSMMNIIRSRKRNLLDNSSLESCFWLPLTN
jgi:hypothetical protein